MIDDDEDDEPREKTPHERRIDALIRQAMTIATSEMRRIGSRSEAAWSRAYHAAMDELTLRAGLRRLSHQGGNDEQ